MIHLAIKAAHLSLYKHKMGAAVVKGNRLLSVACNSIRYKKGTFRKKWINSLHAEQAALLSISPQHARRSTLYIVRVKKDGSLGSSFPCVNCMELIHNLGVKEIVYINDKGEICQEKL